MGASVAESEKLYTDIAKQRPNTLLALNHETYETTVCVPLIPSPSPRCPLLHTPTYVILCFLPSSEQILPFAIQKLKAAGYKFATVAECLGGKQAYFCTLLRSLLSSVSPLTVL